jgi:hypothetical protein
MLPRNRIAAKALAAPVVFCLCTAFGMASARTADADAKACIRAHSSGQRASQAGHLRLAGQLFTTCGSDESCPDQLRKECAEFLETVKKTVPTVIFSVLDEAGQDVSGAKVFSGDDLLADGLDGRAVEVDPGRYHLRFVLPGGEILATDVVVREAEKDRLVQVKKEKAAPIVDAQAAAVAAPQRRSLGPAPWIAAGLAVAGLGTGVTLGVLGSGKESDLDQCKPNCPNDMRSTYSSARGLLLGADIGFGVAVVATGVATWLFVAGLTHGDQTAPAQSSQASRAGGIAPVASYLPGGGLVSVAGAF